MKMWGDTPERLLPNSFQEAYRKPRKLKSHLITYLKVVEMVFLPPQNILECLRYPPGRFNNVFAYFFLIFS